jgi:hypothetical protein
MEKIIKHCKEKIKNIEEGYETFNFTKKCKSYKQGRVSAFKEIISILENDKECKCCRIKTNELFEFEGYELCWDCYNSYSDGYLGDLIPE